MDKRNKLVEQLKVLNINIEKPHQMRISDLESLVNKYKSTVDSRKKESTVKPVKAKKKIRSQMKLTPEQLAIAESNGITRRMISNRVAGLDWTVEDAITVPKGMRRKENGFHMSQKDKAELSMSKEERRALRKHKQSRRLDLLDKITALEEKGASTDEIKLLEKEMANI